MQNNMTINEQKEAAAKQICLYIADQIESKKLDLLGASKLMHFLVTGMEGAEDSEELQKLTQEVKQLWPSLPTFNLVT